MDRWSLKHEIRLPLLLLCAFFYISNAADPIDILKILELSEDMEGVSLEAGLCTSRTGRKETDLSFKIDRKIQVSVPTKQLFPDTPFPANFSLMTTVKAVKGSQVFLFSMYDTQGTQQLGLEVARSPVFLYEDHEGQPTPEFYPTFRKVNLADGKWHRVAYSVNGQSVTLYVDCEKVDTLDLLRGFDPHISTDGVTVFGTRLLDEDVFEGEIQQLLIVDEPGAAETYCQNYIPDCDAALPYDSILSEAVEEERKPKKPVVEDFEEFDYNDLYEEIPVGNEASNMTEYEIVEYEYYDNTTQRPTSMNMRKNMMSGMDLLREIPATLFTHRTYQRKERKESQGILEREQGLRDLMGLQDLRENRDLLESLDQWALEETLESWVLQGDRA
ncbi:hypothetical protein OJAV_G00004040 [Oryzias javanicus]|uniref:Laminin G domain-containing protein n=1 Tax=Oryzias javanicus TaxID=123683 RepID=A0A3S2PHK0_ORYJA|nr:hypothetical protein OJAV_G00004040 [Oryzias javanicus]